MAPRNASKKQAEQAAPAGEDLEFEQETSDPKAISKDMEKNTRARRTHKRNQLSAQYEQEIASLDQQVAIITDTATKQFADLRHNQQQRLRELIRCRSEVEDQIVQHSQVLDKAYEAATREMKAAAKGRLDDLRSNSEEDEDLDGHAGGVDWRRGRETGAVQGRCQER